MSDRWIKIRGDDLFTVFLEHTELKTICLFRFSTYESYKNKAIFHAGPVSSKVLELMRRINITDNRYRSYGGVVNASKGMVFRGLNGKVGDLMNFCPRVSITAPNKTNLEMLIGNKTAETQELDK